ncbi:hypothetical protein J1605_007270 [Eschrichtius robustus]|uniref:Uncharacterized protein n=1 Tax=Eschrichtius robustus TaxID=9764 RepID=A0AB34GZZ8_ESCRO|nr:hypothetical protein J1605_007270 [Eschrichtius robustus]
MGKDPQGVSVSAQHQGPGRTALITPPGKVAPGSPRPPPGASQPAASHDPGPRPSTPARPWPHRTRPPHMARRSWCHPRRRAHSLPATAPRPRPGPAPSPPRGPRPVPARSTARGLGGGAETARVSRHRGRARVLGPPWEATRTRRLSASAKMAAAAGGARLAAWGGRLRRGLAAGRRAWPSSGPVAAAVVGVALAGAGATWYHGRVNVAAPQGGLTVVAQSSDARRVEGAGEEWGAGAAPGSLRRGPAGTVGACPVRPGPQLRPVVQLS